MLMSLRFHATDNFGPGEPHVGAGETMVFRVVPAERLSEELRRRQVEQREELKRIREDEQRLVLELTEMVAPDQAGERRAQVETRLKALVRQQRSLGNRTQFVGDSYQRIIWEYENNRLWEPNNARQQEALIPEPLVALGKDAFPATARQIDAFAGAAAETTRAAALEACRDILRRIDGILKAMEQAESIAALIQDLRSVIKLQSDAIRDVQTRVQKKEEDIFKPRTDAPDDSPKPNDPPKPKNEPPK
jgi:hypothetical protein